MAINFDQYNDRVKSWGQSRKNQLKGSASSLGIRHRESSPSPGSSIEKIATRFSSKQGLVSQVTFTFPRSLIWPHKGAGKGMGGSKGSSWVNKYGNARTTKEKSKGKAGSGSRQPKPWFNRVMDGPDGVERLADIVAEETGDIIVNDLFIK